jgi:alanine racemase
MNNSQQSYATWAEVDLSAIRTNVDYFLDRTKSQVMAVVKANAYGHGAVPVAEAALAAGVSWCAVARTEEAVELRKAGVDCPILILGYTPAYQIEKMIELGVSLSVWNLEQAELISAAASKSRQTARLHMLVDTGMSRLGVQIENALELIGFVSHLPHVKLEGLFTHFARADEADQTTADLQENIFQDLIEKVEGEGIEIPLIHAANSAASLNRPSVHFNCIRLGIAMYGLHPSPDCLLPVEVRPALKWKAVLSQVKTLPAGRGISYGHQYTTTKPERIGTIPVGYADGFRRLKGNQVLVGGQSVPVIGRVTMDQIMVQLDDVPDVREGDEVVLIGDQGSNRVSAEDLARLWDTINYEVVSGISKRVPRIYT